MNSKFFLTAALAATVALSSCNKLGELSADNFTVTPSPLEAVAGQVPVTINGRFPEKYMKKKAIVTVTPVLRYAGGEFEAVADWWINQYLARAVTMQARQKGVGSKMRGALEAYREADKHLLTLLGRNPTMEEIAAEMGISAEEAEVYQDMLRTARTMEKAKQPPKEQEPEDDQAVEDTAYFQSRQRILDMLSTLTEQEAQVLTLRFGLEGGQPCTPQQVGAKLNMTADTVVQLEAAALSKLRNQEK